MNVGNKGSAKPNVPSKAIAKRGSNSSNTPAAPGVPEITHTRCKVCNSTYRRQIDMCLVSGWSQTEVAKHFNQIMGEEHFNKMNISRHSRFHLDARDAAVRRIIEKRAAQQLGDIDEIEGMITTKMGAVEVIVQRGLEQVNAGVMELKGGDVLDAIKLLDTMESEWKETALDELTNEFKAFAAIVKEEVGEDRFKEIFARWEGQMEHKEQKALMPLDAENADEIVGEATEEDDDDAGD